MSPLLQDAHLNVTHDRAASSGVLNTHEPARVGHIAAEALHEDHVPLVAEALVQVNHREEKAFRKSMCTLLPDSGQTTKLANANEKPLTT